MGSEEELSPPRSFERTDSDRKDLAVFSKGKWHVGSEQLSPALDRADSRQDSFQRRRFDVTTKNGWFVRWTSY